MDEIKIIRQNLNLIENSFIKQNEEFHKVNEAYDRYKSILLELLNSKIGHKIYWANKNWKKYETHTISGIDIAIQIGSFFGEEYKGKECIRIYLDGGGYFIADQIGKDIFFNEKEAALRTKKE